MTDYDRLKNRTLNPTDVHEGSWGSYYSDKLERPAFLLPFDSLEARLLENLMNLNN